MAKSVIERLRASEGEEARLAFFSGDCRENALETARNILHSIVKMLLAADISDTSRSGLSEMATFLGHTGNQFGARQMSDCFSLIISNLKRTETLFLVLDGLDECESTCGHSLLHELVAIASYYDQCHRIKSLITSKPSSWVHERKSRGTEIEISQLSCTAYIADYAQKRAGELHLSYDSPIVRSLVQNIISIAHGSFLVIDLGIRCLAKKRESHWKNKSLEEPVTTDLLGIYHYMLYSALDQNAAFFLLQCVYCAARPLFSWELFAMLSMKTGYRDGESDLVKLSGDLLIVLSDRTVTFIHSSVRDYLESCHKRGSCSDLTFKSHEMIAQICFQTLSHELLQSFCPPFMEERATFANYALRFWWYHYGIAERESRNLPWMLHEVLTKFIELGFTSLLTSNLSGVVRQQISLSYKSTFGPVSDLRQQINEFLRIGAYFGFEKLVKLELHMGARSHKLPGVRGDTSLHLSAEGNHINIVQQLLAHGANPNVKDVSGKTPLAYAVANGNWAVVKALLEGGAKLDVEFDSVQALLSDAIAGADAESVELLLKHGIKASSSITGNIKSPQVAAVELALRELWLALTFSKACSTCGKRQVHLTVRESSILTV